MARFLPAQILVALSLLLLSGCARDLSSNVYTSDATQSLTLEGRIISARQITIKSSDKLSDNPTGILAGGAMGGAAGSTVGRGHGAAPAIIGGVIVGAVIGSAVEHGLGTSDGYEYVVKLNKASIKDSVYYEGSAAMRAALSAASSTGLLTVIQGLDNPLKKGEKVYVIVSDKRTRVIPVS